MSWSKEFTIWCDGHDCPEWLTLCVNTKSAAQAEARRSGWRAGKRDLCPACQDAEKHEKKLARSAWS